MKKNNESTTTHIIKCLVPCVLGKSYRFPFGSFSFAKLVLNKNNALYMNTLDFIKTDN